MEKTIRYVRAGSGNETLFALLKKDGILLTSSPSFLNPRGYVWMTLQLLFDVPMSPLSTDGYRTQSRWSRSVMPLTNPPYTAVLSFSLKALARVALEV